MANHYWCLLASLALLLVIPGTTEGATIRAHLHERDLAHLFGRSTVGAADTSAADCGTAEALKLCHFMNSELVERDCRILEDELARPSSKVAAVFETAGCIAPVRRRSHGNVEKASVCARMEEAMKAMAGNGPSLSEPVGEVTGNYRWPCEYISCDTGSFFGYYLGSGECQQHFKVNFPYGFKPKHLSKPSISELRSLPKECDVNTLPTDPIVVKTPTLSFNHYMDFAVHCGRLWYRYQPNGDGNWFARYGSDAHWRLVSIDGLPKQPFLENDLTKVGPVMVEDDRKIAVKTFTAADDVVAVSADGDNLVATSSSGNVYYAKIQGFIWQGRWGLNEAASNALDIDLGPPGWLMLPHQEEPGTVTLAISHRGFYNKLYHDQLGSEFDQPIGVTTLYSLDPKGHDLAYADPWLPTDWNRRFCGPGRNTIKMIALSASCSTMMVMDTTGTVWTRFADYDTSGKNPVFPYTLHCFDVDRFDWDTLDWTPIPGCKPLTDKKYRALPPEGWKSHGNPAAGQTDALISTDITISQNGQDTEARQLRVVGSRAGVVGTWTKPSLNDPWVFEADVSVKLRPEAVVTPSVDAIRRPAQDSRFMLAISSTIQGVPISGTITVSDFNPDCPPANVEFNMNGDTATATLHFYKEHRMMKRQHLPAIRRWQATLLRPVTERDEMTDVARYLRKKLTWQHGEGSDSRQYSKVFITYSEAPDGRSTFEMASQEDGADIPFTGEGVRLDFALNKRRDSGKFTFLMKEVNMPADVAASSGSSSEPDVASVGSGIEAERRSNGGVDPADANTADSEVHSDVESLVGPDENPGLGDPDAAASILDSNVEAITRGSRSASNSGAPDFVQEFDN